MTRAAGNMTVGAIPTTHPAASGSVTPNDLINSAKHYLAPATKGVISGPPHLSGTMDTILNRPGSLKSDVYEIVFEII